MSDHRLKRTTIAAFALPAIPMSALGLPLAVYLPPLYASSTALSLSMVGILFFVARMFDIVTDPLFGIASDRTESRFGRRRPWIVLSVPILMLAVFKTFNPPADAGALYLLSWLFVLYLGYTLFTLSHIAWGAELSANYDERSRVQGWREFSLIFGMLTVLFLPALLELQGIDTTARSRASMMANYILVMLPLTVAVAVWRVPETLVAIKQTPLRLLSVLKSLRGNPFLSRVLAADLFQGIGPAITGALYVWLAEYYLRLPDATSIILLTYFVAATAGMPLWMQLAYRIGKHNAFAVAMVFGSCALVSYFAMPKESLTWALLGTVVYGTAYGAGSFLLRAMMADVIDHDRLETGENRTGVYYSLLTLTAKFGGAFGPLIAYPFLDWVGFNPKDGVETAPGAETWVMVAFAVPPIIVYLAAAVAMWRFPLDRAVQEDMRRKIAARETDMPFTAPITASAEPKPPDAGLRDARPAE